MELKVHTHDMTWHGSMDKVGEELDASIHTFQCLNLMHLYDGSGVKIPRGSIIIVSMPTRVQLVRVINNCCDWVVLQVNTLIDNTMVYYSLGLMDSCYCG